MKRVIYIVLSLVMSLSLFGCGARTYPVEQVHEHVTGFSVDEVSDEPFFVRLRCTYLSC